MNTNIEPKKNFTQGPLFFRITLFTIPIMLTGILQIFYGMADNIVVGKFSGDPVALAAVGSTGTLNTLVINLLLGIAAGTGVVIAQLYGANEKRLLERTVHTTVVFAFVGGIDFMIVGLLVSRPVLILMGTKPEVLDKAVLYMRIICLGIPANSVYNFGASILRAVGNSKIPLTILASSGIVNVILNVVFVVCCGMSVDGVAIATIISQYISAAAVIGVLMLKKNESYAFSFRKLCFDNRLLGRVLRYGIPTGIQSSMFGISNMLITSAVNSFPTATVSASTIAGNIDGLAYTMMNSFAQAAMTFTGQNWGAGKTDRIRRVYRYSLIQVFLFGIVGGQLVRLLSRPLASLYISTDNPEYEIIITTAIEICTLILSTYCIFGLVDVHSGFLRGMGYSLIPMITSLVCICVIRVIWIYCIFFRIDALNSHVGLYACYPVSWVIALAAFAIISIGAFKKLKNIDKANLERGQENEKNKVSVQ